MSTYLLIDAKIDTYIPRETHGAISLIHLGCVCAESEQAHANTVAHNFTERSADDK